MLSVHRVLATIGASTHLTQANISAFAHGPSRSLLVASIMLRRDGL
jgi:hypothetical protein